MEHQGEDECREALVLKKLMLFSIMIGGVLMCVSCVINQQSRNFMHYGNQVLAFKLNTVAEGLYLVSFCIYGHVCRPRKTWPPFFDLNTNDEKFTGVSPSDYVIQHRSDEYGPIFGS